MIQRIKGETLLSRWLAHPLRFIWEMRDFVQLQQRILSVPLYGEFDSVHDVIYHCASLPPKVDPDTLGDVFSLLREMPESRNLCHGDFHPGNVMCQGNQRYVIDWSAFHTGPPLSDIAHSYLLMRDSPNMGEKGLKRLAIWMSSRVIAWLYLYQARQLGLVDLCQGEWEKWCVVMSLFRIYYGLPQEERLRKNYLISSIKKIKKRKIVADNKRR